MLYEQLPESGKKCYLNCQYTNPIYGRDIVEGERKIRLLNSRETKLVMTQRVE